jgi:4,5-dihydroxyphthalate decarboxylase
MTSIASAPLTLKTNLAESAITHALRSGAIQSDDFSFEFCGPKSAHNGFKAMVRDRDFDAGELAIVTFFQAKEAGAPLVMLPAPIVGRFQHHCIGYCADEGVMGPKDIEGRRVGVRSYTQTTGMWVRGILRHEYGVDLDRVTWLCAEEAHVLNYRDPPNCVRLPLGGKPLAQMMLDRDVDAAILGADMPNDPRVRHLIADPFFEAQRWHEKTGIIPVNHMFVINQQLSRSRPDVVREMYRMIAKSRAGASPEELAALPPLGLEPNRKALELAIEWSLEQKLISRKISVDEPFDDTTAI